MEVLNQAVINDFDKVNKLVKSAAKKFWSKAYHLCWHVFSEFEDLEQVGWVRLCESKKLRDLISKDIKGKEGLIRIAAYRGMVDYARSVIGREDTKSARGLQLYKTTRYMDYYSKFKSENEVVNVDDILDYMLPESTQETHEDVLVYQSIQKEIDDFMNKKLSKREKMIMDYIYVNGETMKDVGKLFKVSDSRISQIHTNAIKAAQKKFA